MKTDADLALFCNCLLWSWLALPLDNMDKKYFGLFCFFKVKHRVSLPKTGWLNTFNFFIKLKKKKKRNMWRFGLFHVTCEVNGKKLCASKSKIYLRLVSS